MNIVAATSGSLDACSVALADGRRGTVPYKYLMKGTKCIPSWLRRDTIRPSADGQALLIDRHTYRIKGMAQGEDEVLTIPIERVVKLMSAKVQKSFQVDGQHGPMTLAFQYIGPAAKHQRSLPDEVLHSLTREAVQDWYTNRGWPKGGILTSVDRRNNPLAHWQMV